MGMIIMGWKQPIIYRSLDALFLDKAICGNSCLPQVMSTAPGLLGVAANLEPIASGNLLPSH